MNKLIVIIKYPEADLGFSEGGKSGRSGYTISCYFSCMQFPACSPLSADKVLQICS